MRSPVVAMSAAILATLVFAMPASAAPDLQETSIRGGESFDLSPFSFQASYARDVTLTSARVVDQDGKVTAIAIEGSTRGRLIAVDLPVLAPHAYRLEWRVREVSGAEAPYAVAFVVRGCDDPRLAAALRAKP